EARPLRRDTAVTLPASGVVYFYSTRASFATILVEIKYRIAKIEIISMIRRLTINGFRGFQNYEVGNLGRVNLLVGTNNCGKTTVLEAVNLLASTGDVSAISELCARRGERLIDTDKERREYEFGVNHLFFGHSVGIASTFRFEAETDQRRETFRASIHENLEQRFLFDDKGEGGAGSENRNFFEEPALLLDLDWSLDDGKPIRIPLSVRGGFTHSSMRRVSRIRTEGERSVQFISTGGLLIDSVIDLFENIVLSSEEELVIDALRSIDPQIQRIATITNHRRYSSTVYRGGFVVKLDGLEQRVPIGSMGDGIWRMLGLALAIASAKGGIVLIDEIDTGLHFTVLEKMWRLVYEAAKRLDVQVFATTHSRDAYESLAAIARPGVSDESDVTIQRIDSSGSTAVTFTEQEIIASAEHDTEVR
ncbi:MAG: ATP-binding protein, partial [Pirellulales bacterium]